MGQKARTDDIEEILPGFQHQTNDQIRSKAGRLIDALQARAIFDARAIAAELTKDRAPSDTSEARSALSEVSDLLQSDAVFSNCDCLSYLLLDLEQKLNNLGSPASKLCVQPSLDSHERQVPVGVDANYDGGLKGIECAPQ